MKKLALVIVICLFSIISFSQEKPYGCKGEKVSLNKINFVRYVGFRGVKFRLDYGLLIKYSTFYSLESGVPIGGLKLKKKKRIKDFHEINDNYFVYSNYKGQVFKVPFKSFEPHKIKEYSKLNDRVHFDECILNFEEYLKNKSSLPANITIVKDKLKRINVFTGGSYIKRREVFIWELEYIYNNQYYFQIKMPVLKNFHTSGNVSYSVETKDYYRWQGKRYDGEFEFGYYNFNKEAAIAEEAMAKKSIELFEKYKKLYPQGDYISKVNESLEQAIYLKSINTNNFDYYLSRYTNGKFIEDCLEKKEQYLYKNALSNKVFETYIKEYPQGKYIDIVKQKAQEHEVYLKQKQEEEEQKRIAQEKEAEKRRLREQKQYEQDLFVSAILCGTQSSTYKNFKSKYGYKSEFNSVLKEMEDYTNKNKWYLGDNLCYTFGCEELVVATLEEWNENKSRIKVKVLANTYPYNNKLDANILNKGNTFWTDPDKWHKAIEFEFKYAVNNDKSDLISEDGIIDQCGDFRVGQTITYEARSSLKGWAKLLLAPSDCSIKLVVEEKAANKLKCRVTSDDNCELTWDGEYIYKGDILWINCFDNNIKN